MRRQIKVFIGQNAQVVGTLYHDHQGGREHAAFEYDEGWLKEPAAFAIEPNLKLVAGPQYHKKARHS